MLANAFASITRRIQLPVRISVKGNESSRIGWGIRAVLPAWPAGSSFTLDGNRLPNQTSHTDIDASAWVGVSGNKATLLTNNNFGTAANVFTGMTQPGRGRATFTSGSSFITVTNTLGVVPDFVSLTVVDDPTVTTMFYAPVANLTTSSFRIYAKGTPPTADVRIDYQIWSKSGA